MMQLLGLTFILLLYLFFCFTINLTEGLGQGVDKKKQLFAKGEVNSGEYLPRHRHGQIFANIY